MQGREQYYDSIKWLSAIYIFLTHFIAEYCDEIFVCMKKFPYSLFLYGITGKLMVTIFLVLLGYFAMQKGEKHDISCSVYTLKRYIDFVVIGFFAHLLYILGGQIKFNMEFLREMLMEIFLLKSNYVGVLWTSVHCCIGILLYYECIAVAFVVCLLIIICISGIISKAIKICACKLYQIVEIGKIKKRVDLISILMLLVIGLFTLL